MKITKEKVFFLNSNSLIRCNSELGNMHVGMKQRFKYCLDWNFKIENFNSLYILKGVYFN